MIFFRIVWGIAAIIALVGWAFFFIGLADGSVSTFIIVLWTAVLAGLTAVVFGSRALASKGHVVAAGVLAGVLVVPGLLYALFLIVALTGGVRWN
jgi:hypothetical protein